MATSGTYNFNLPVDELIEEALEMVGGDILNHEDLRSARRSLNLLFQDIQNNWYPLATLKQERITVVEGQATYDLDTTYLDLVDVIQVRPNPPSSASNTNEYPMERRSLFDYHKLPVKDQRGRPLTYTVDKTNPNAPKMILWPTPDNSTDMIDFWAIQRIQDVSASAQTVDFDTKYLPALTMGLAYFMSLKRDNVSPEKRGWLKAEYQERLENSYHEDRERSALNLGMKLNRVR